MGIDDMYTLDSSLQDIASVCALCNEAQIEYRDGTFARIGEPTEAALKVLVEKLGAPGVTKLYDHPTVLARWDHHSDNDTYPMIITPVMSTHPTIL